MKTVTDTYAAPAKRSETARVLANRLYRQRRVKARKGKGSFTRERIIQLKVMLEVSAR